MRDSGINIGPSIYDSKKTDNAALIDSMRENQIAAMMWLIEHGHNRGLNIEKVVAHLVLIECSEQLLDYITLLRANFKQVKYLRDRDGLITTKIQDRLGKLLIGAESSRFVPFMEWMIELGYKVSNKTELHYGALVCDPKNHPQWSINLNWLLDHHVTMKKTEYKWLLETATMLGDAKLIKRLEEIKNKNKKASSAPV